MERIAILAGGGTLPLVLADCIARRGGTAHIVGVRGEAGVAIERYPHTWVTWGAVNRILATLKRESDGAMMIAGSVSRPDLARLKPDLGVIRYLPQILTMLKGGDDAVLTRLIGFFEAQGLTVKGVGDIAPQLLAEAGSLGSAGAGGVATRDCATDTALGFQVLDVLADLDVGQAIAVEGGRILAIEGVEGTDRMLARLSDMPGRPPHAGVLVKGPKRGQDLRVDMPAVGAATIDRLAEARLGTLVVVAGQTLLLERDEMVRRANGRQITIQVVVRDHVASDKPPIAQAPHWTSPPLGRLTPTAADSRDARTAAKVILRLQPFATGQAAVVVREHVLAVAANETPAAMARRVALLRQWGGGRLRRRRGAAAIVMDAGDDPVRLLALVEGLAGTGIAGVAVIDRSGGYAGPSYAVPATTIAAADRLGLFVAVLGADGASATIEAA